MIQFKIFQTIKNIGEQNILRDVGQKNDNNNIYNQNVTTKYDWSSSGQRNKLLAVQVHSDAPFENSKRNCCIACHCVWPIFIPTGPFSLKLFLYSTHFSLCVSLQLLYILMKHGRSSLYFVFVFAHIFVYSLSFPLMCVLLREVFVVIIIILTK